MTEDRVAAARVAERAGAEHLGASVYELAPGGEMVFHYHVQREELPDGIPDAPPDGIPDDAWMAVTLSSYSPALRGKVIWPPAFSGVT